MMLDYGAACGSDGVGIYNTVDGETSWTLVSSATPDQAGSPGELPFGGDKSGFSFIDSKRGWVAGHTNGSGFYLYVTSDGGKTWNNGPSLTVPKGLSTENGAAATYPPVFYSDDGLLPVLFNVGTDGPSIVFYRTNDRGLTWKETSPLKLTSYSQITWSIPDMKHVFASDGQQIYATGDGGQTWKNISPDLKSGPIRQLDFINVSTGWILGDSFLMQTRDGGANWTDKDGRQSTVVPATKC